MGRTSVCRWTTWVRSSRSTRASFVTPTSRSVKKTERLDEAVAPDGTVLTLYRHDDSYFIRVDGIELMSTRRHHSEEKLAELCCSPLRNVGGARVLIGGLGL